MPDGYKVGREQGESMWSQELYADHMDNWYELGKERGREVNPEKSDDDKWLEDFSYGFRDGLYTMYCLQDYE